MDPRLYRYAISGDIHSLKELLDRDSSILLRCTPQGNTALHVAARSGKRSMFAEIYSRCKSLLMQPNSEGDTPLHVASGAGHLSVVKFLVIEITSTSPSQLDIESGCNCNFEMLRWENRRNDTALHEAIRKGHSQVARLLIKADSRLLLHENRVGESPLYLAARGGMKEIVDWILTSCPLSVHGGSDGQTALHAAVSARYSDIVKTLIRAKPELIKEVDHHGRTPLYYAAFSGYHKLVQQLLELDISTAYVVDTDGFSPLHAAASNGHAKVIKEIMRLCPDAGELVDQRGQNVLHVAVLSGRANVVRYILDTVELEGLINMSDHNGNTPLHLSIMERRSWIAAYLLWDVRVDRTARNMKGETAFDMDEPTMEARVVPSIAMVNRRQLRLPQHWDFRRGILPGTNEQKAVVLDSEQSYKQNCQTLLMVAALITTVTFAAAFTMPGGYNANAGPGQGMALLRSSGHLKWFVISDTVAMTCSIMAASLILWGAAFGDRPYVHCYVIAAVLTCIALQSTAISFVTGLVAVLPDQRYVHTMASIVAYTFYVNTCLFLFRLAQIISYSEICLFMVSRLRRLKCIINSQIRVQRETSTSKHVFASQLGALTLGDFRHQPSFSIEIRAYVVDTDGFSSFHAAASNGHAKVIKEIMRQCPDAGELVDQRGQNVLHVAILRGRANVVRYILDTVELEGLINMPDHNGNTPLHLSIMERRSWIAAYLLWDVRVDRTARNVKGETAFDMDEPTMEARVIPSVAMVNRRQLRLPRHWDFRRGILPGTNEQKADVLDSGQTYKQNCRTLLMVAALITTVTFAAAFTMPGGYNANAGPGQGMALLRSSGHLKWFVISDTVAMTCSIMVASLILWGAAFGDRPYVHCYVIAAVLTCIALQSTAISFVTGLVAVLPDQRYVHTMASIVAYAFYVNTCLFLFRLAQIISYSEICLFMVSRLRRLKCIINSHIVNR
ncbi:protein ACCELERATED CELL DEATH 6 [Rhodamnia argentea]|uniref:Protein ACCELERATED CELL DEATH 6 n=1 Tax=Rhodamnia argentea TaxID=178133 RepID=A0A8B8Q709_9MYRT|nr:protein ACCELERATED CELL DEATH 6 [Rhodamnia argentea]